MGLIIVITVDHQLSRFHKIRKILGYDKPISFMLTYFLPNY